MFGNISIFDHFCFLWGKPSFGRLMSHSPAGHQISHDFPRWKTPQKSLKSPMASSHFRHDMPWPLMTSILWDVGFVWICFILKASADLSCLLWKVQLEDAEAIWSRTWNPGSSRPMLQPLVPNSPIPRSNFFPMVATVSDPENSQHSEREIEIRNLSGEVLCTLWSKALTPEDLKVDVHSATDIPPSFFEFALMDNDAATIILKTDCPWDMVLDLAGRDLEGETSRLTTKILQLCQHQDVALEKHMIEAGVFH